MFVIKVRENRAVIRLSYPHNMSIKLFTQKCLKRYRELMNDVKYPTDTEEEMSNIHKEHKTEVVKDFTEAAKSLNKVSLGSELEVGSAFKLFYIVDSHHI